MNGRVYDPTLGRFLSVDPVFQFPTNTQSLNPYSYVLNNPLSLTDPTGYWGAIPDVPHTQTGVTIDGGWGGSISNGGQDRDSKGNSKTVAIDKLTGLFASVGIKFDSNLKVVGGQFENGAKFGQDISEGQLATTQAATGETGVSQGRTLEQISGMTSAQIDSVIESGPLLAGNDVKPNRIPIDCDSVATCESGAAERDYIEGRISKSELDDVHSGQAFGAAAGVGVVAAGAAGYEAYPTIAAFLRKYIAVDGPSPGLKYGNGRIFGIRFKDSQFGIRLDYHPLRPGGPSVLHLNIGPSGSESLHIPLFDPSWFGGGK